MTKPRTDSAVSKASLAKYLAGDVIIVLLWSFLIGFTAYLTSLTSLYLIPLWIYIGLCVMALLIPKVKPGVYNLDSKQAALWFFSFQFNRIWAFPPFKWIIFSSATLRTIFLRCCGAKVSMNIGWSSYSTMSDPSMFVIEEDVIIGMDSIISGHTIINGKLLLKRVTLKKGSLVSARCAVGPGCYVGEGAILQGNINMLPGAFIPNGTQIGLGSTVSAAMKLEENKIYPWFMRPPEKSAEKQIN